MSGRSVLLVLHSQRAGGARDAEGAVAALTAGGVDVRVLADEADAPDLPDAPRLEGARVVQPGPAAAEGCELVLSLGGDGTFLRAAEAARPTRTPVLGVNLGHVGFLAEAERDDLGAAVEAVLDGRYEVQERLALDVLVRYDGRVERTWALNEASVEKASRQRILEVVVEVDGRPLSRWGCDGVLCATPTGSTAYAFSAGGPVVWPEVEAMLLVPLSAHALFARPLVTAPDSVLAVELLAESRIGGTLLCDGRRSIDLPPGARVEVRRSADPVRLVRLHRDPFTDRLVAKFDLPVEGWRGRGRPPAGGPQPGAAPPGPVGPPA
ncbi:NAD kinase [Vallicoccus soli]|uniref:NAD kinase n=1 Tax=Vallicoccus soli TaxID=2339232 RepID=A0A3A3YR42_9ACTN|nr:NAD kinase [Vallicoccus soli]RJK93113.1 NAD kinase [Vallicoccus soli]